MTMWKTAIAHVRPLEANYVLGCGQSCRGVGASSGDEKVAEVRAQEGEVGEPPPSPPPQSSPSRRRRRRSDLPSGVIEM